MEDHLGPFLSVHFVGGPLGTARAVTNSLGKLLFGGCPWGQWDTAHGSQGVWHFQAGSDAILGFLNPGISRALAERCHLQTP